MPLKNLYDDSREVYAFAKKSQKREDELGALARAFLDLHSDMKMVEKCLAKADHWLQNARG